MTSLAVTNTLSNGAVILASEHNTNYSDIVTYINNRNSGSSTWDAISVSNSSTVPVVINNSTGTQDIFRAQDNGSNVFVVSDGGSITTVNQSAFRAYRNTSSQTISTGSDTKIQFNGETYDVKSEFDSATNYRFTATVAGKYTVASVISTAVLAAGTATLTLKKNGSTITRVDDSYPAAVTSSSITLADTISMAASDYIEMFLTQDTGSNLTIASGESLTYFAAHKIA